MNVKDYLSEYRNINSELNTLNEALSNAHEEYNEYECEKKPKLKKAYKRYLSALEKIIIKVELQKNNILNFVNNIPDEISQKIIYKHFIEDKPFHKISMDLLYSEVHIKRLYYKAMQELEKTSYRKKKY